VDADWDFVVVFTYMFNSELPKKAPLFDYFPPLGAHFRGIVSVPHSGETIPEAFHPFLSGDLQAYREDVDFKVNELIDISHLQKSGIAVMVSNIHRICVDLNRSEDQCVLFWKENTQGKKLVLKEPTPLEVEKFIESYHRPYFEMLKANIRDLEGKKKGPVSVIDLHSMPSTPTAYHMKQNPKQEVHRPEFCVSDRRGKTCLPEFINFFQEEFIKNGYDSRMNDPYVGGFVTEFVDRFRTNNIQIEIKRSIYMDETTKELIPSFVQDLKPFLTSVIIMGMETFDS
jgi:N-formylglutamate amidohydrolase